MIAFDIRRITKKVRVPYLERYLRGSNFQPKPFPLGEFDDKALFSFIFLP
jgi:hypothetical protein